MELTRTDAVFSRIAMVLFYVQMEDLLERDRLAEEQELLERNRLVEEQHIADLRRERDMEQQRTDALSREQSARN